MTIAKAIREVFEAMSWAVNSEIVFFIVVVVISIPLIYYALGSLWRFLRNRYFAPRRRHDE